MADCGDYSHQAIEYRGLFDLKNAQIIRAEIDSIDSANNTASVTLLDSCDFDDWLDTGAVPFFYHCETSTGTVEDLAKGYKAFAEGDMVYLLLNQAQGEDIPAQAYVVGHVDIKGTRSCNSEVILITQETKNSDVWQIIYVLFVPSTGGLLDISSFENINELSPPKPSSAIGILTDEINSWINYNFDNVLVTVNAPFSVTSNVDYDDDTPYVSVYDTIEREPYNGTYWRITSSGDACDGYNLGNQAEHYKRERLSERTSDGAYSYFLDFEMDGEGCGTYHYGDGSENNCSFYWEHFTHKTVWEWSYGNAVGYTIFDHTTSESKKVSIESRYNLTRFSETFCDGETFSANAYYDYTATHGFDFSVLNRELIVNTHRFRADARLAGYGPGNGAEIQSNPDSASGKIGWIRSCPSVGRMSGFLCMEDAFVNNTIGYPLNASGSAFMVGAEGFYAFLFGHAMAEMNDVNTSSAVITLGGPPSILDTVGGWNNEASLGLIDEDNDEYKVIYSLVASVTLYSQAGIDTSVPVSIFECLEKADIEKSDALTSIVVGIVDQVNPLEYRWRGPAYKIIKKKAVI